MNRYFVTGTDTGVGKTYVTCAIARLAASHGRRVLAVKPIETGVPREAELGEDQAALSEAAGGWQTSDARGIYRYELAAAPLPASLSGEPIDIPRVLRAIEQAQENTDLVLVEGAGGLRVPVATFGSSVIDMGRLALMLAMPLIIVARSTLGTINHTLLTIEAAERDGLDISAVVMSHRPTDQRSHAESNANEVRRRWSGNVIVFTGDSAVLERLL